jgi:hypothetical protein
LIAKKPDQIMDDHLLSGWGRARRGRRLLLSGMPGGTGGGCHAGVFRMGNIRGSLSGSCIIIEFLKMTCYIPLTGLSPVKNGIPGAGAGETEDPVPG